MALINIFYTMVMLLLSSVVLVIGVFTEGVARLFGKITEYLEATHKWLVKHSERKPKKKAGKYAVQLAK